MVLASENSIVGEGVDNAAIGMLVCAVETIIVGEEVANAGFASVAVVCASEKSIVGVTIEDITGSPAPVACSA